MSRSWNCLHNTTVSNVWKLSTYNTTSESHDESEIGFHLLIPIERLLLCHNIWMKSNQPDRHKGTEITPVAAMLHALIMQVNDKKYVSRNGESVDLYVHHTWSVNCLLNTTICNNNVPRHCIVTS